MDLQAVLFDFDYTLGDATDVIVEGFWYAFDQLGLPRPGREAVRRTIGHKLEDEYTLLTGDTDLGRLAQFGALYRQQANPRQITGTRLFPGAVELLSALRAAGLHTGVVSTKRTDTLLGVVEHCGIAPLLDLVTGGDLVARPKPDPEGLLAALHTLDLAPGQALYCGDTVLDAGAAQRAGVPFCAVLNGTTPAADFAPFPFVHIAPDLWDLKRWLAL